MNITRWFCLPLESFSGSNPLAYQLFGLIGLLRGLERVALGPISTRTELQIDCASIDGYTD